LATNSSISGTKDLNSYYCVLHIAWSQNQKIAKPTSGKKKGQKNKRFFYFEEKQSSSQKIIQCAGTTTMKCTRLEKNLPLTKMQN
jgi:hypothetical protein